MKQLASTGPKQKYFTLIWIWSESWWEPGSALFDTEEDAYQDVCGEAFLIWDAEDLGTDFFLLVAEKKFEEAVAYLNEKFEDQVSIHIHEHAAPLLPTPIRYSVDELRMKALAVVET
ncbi:MAG: hypothetical protein GTO63_21465 [Anaerolineae bacterium]|nr:hypothetical protein [Anaerolineae bacterium]NIQ80275.1 hypothetical protein [Anaerolineae bacterium]